MTAPAWETIPHEITCPLCEYNLRGLAGNRCPECGHQFNLSELLKAKESEHPFLIEHGRRGLLERYRKTFRTSIGVRGIWQTVTPSHRLNAGRLVAYKLSQWAMFGVGSVVVLVVMIGYSVAAHAYARVELARRFSHRTHSKDMVQTMVDQEMPSLAFTAHVSNAMVVVEDNLPPLIIMFGTMVFWPWLLFITQFVFLESLRRKQIHRAHLLRCAVYSSDVAVFWFVPFLLVFGGVEFLRPHSMSVFGAWGGSGWNELLNDAMRCSLPLMLLWLTWRLVQAYRSYLRFPHAAASAIGAAVITILTLLSIFNLFIPNMWYKLGIIDWMIYFK